MKAYKLEILVIDHEGLDASNIVHLIEDCKYIDPSVLVIKEADIGEWHDDHPLNGINTQMNFVMATDWH